MKPKLKDLHNALNSYLTVHDFIFKQKFGQQLDYKMLRDMLESSLKTLIQCRDYFSDSKNLKPEKKSLIISYINDVSTAVENLDILTVGLEKKATGAGSYGVFKYRKDLKNYKLSSQLHMRYGEQLNEIYREYSI